ncbi:hypothetical protein I6F35_32005 [Bradyrhizobium sp. BRP22]|uniref:hypothetical protein n=1 Tax=Bradyrhizobium sp. BRP22 TaxID=2793821 RepID=UPI001CD2AECE|nr:hypothetical protein [Bradyrhizobium sp. BRP22]MCA1457756.1 hypothetical protein [Bradyrhizobium sp. BRP22]
MTTTTESIEVIDKHGRRVRRDSILEDGDRLSVRVSMMDSAHPGLQSATAVTQALRRAEQFDASLAGHKPGFRVADAAVTVTAEHLREQRDAAMSNRWRNPPPIIDQQQMTPTTAPSNATLTHEQLIAARDKRISEAWKS